MRRVLLLAVENPSLNVARAPRALARAGFEVAALAPQDHLICYSSDLAERLTYRAPMALPDFHHALVDLVTRWRPDVVLAGDDVSLWLLHRLRMDTGVAGAVPFLAELLARSLSDRDWLDLERKSVVSEIVRSLEIPVARQIVDPSLEQAREFARAHGYPLVVKLDASWGGLGVRVCASEAELLEGLAWDPDLPLLGAARARALQPYLGGDDLIVAYAAWHGELRACLPLRKVQRVRGDASVVRTHHDERLVEAARRVVARFGITGVGDMDFRCDGKGVPHFLEVNPRIVPAVGFGWLHGVDLCAALLDAVEGRDIGLRLPRPEDDRVVAMFPHEWLRDPASPYLWEACHEVPWDDVPLLKELVRRARRPSEIQTPI